MQRQPYTTLSDATRMSVAPGLPGTRPWVGWLLFLIVACALLGTAWQRFAGEPLNDEAGPVQWQRTLNFADRPNGDIAVLDATSGQNAVQQATAFKAACDVSGIFLAKLDGTAKGGIVVAIRDALDVPVKLVGVGETPDDVQSFDPDRFVEAMFAE